MQPDVVDLMIFQTINIKGLHHQVATFLINIKQKLEVQSYSNYNLIQGNMVVISSNHQGAKGAKGQRGKGACPIHSGTLEAFI